MIEGKKKPRNKQLFVFALNKCIFINPFLKIINKLYISPLNYFVKKNRNKFLRVFNFIIFKCQIYFSYVKAPTFQGVKPVPGNAYFLRNSICVFLQKRSVNICFSFRRAVSLLFQRYFLQPAVVMAFSSRSWSITKARRRRHGKQAQKRMGSWIASNAITISSLGISSSCNFTYGRFF